MCLEGDRKKLEDKSKTGGNPDIKFTNEMYTLILGAPLLRAGIELKVGPFSKKYALGSMVDALEIVRAFNQSGKNYRK